METNTKINITEIDIDSNKMLVLSYPPSMSHFDLEPIIAELKTNPPFICIPNDINITYIEHQFTCGQGMDNNITAEWDLLDTFVRAFHRFDFDEISFPVECFSNPNLVKDFRYMRLICESMETTISDNQQQLIIIKDGDDLIMEQKITVK